MSLASIDNALRRAFGQGVKAMASTYSVYRLGGLGGQNTPNEAASVIDPLNLIYPNYQARIAAPNTPRNLLEVEPIYKMIYLGFCDTRPLQIGDILVENGPNTTDSPDGRIFTLADVQPMLPPQFPRVEILANLTRPSASSDDVTLGKGVYQGISKLDSQICVLASGMYSFATAGISSTIPIGLQPYTRMGPSQESKYPSATRRTQYFIYCPLLPGVEILTGDEFTDQNGNRYIVESISTLTTGLQGTLAIAISLFT